LHEGGANGSNGLLFQKGIRDKLMWVGDHQTTQKEGGGKEKGKGGDTDGSETTDTDSRRSSRIYDLPRFTLKSLSMVSYEAKNRTENKSQEGSTRPRNSKATTVGRANEELLLLDACLLVFSSPS